VSPETHRVRRHVHGSDHSACIEAADVQAHGKHNRLLQRDGTIGNREQSKGYGRAVGEHDGGGAAGGHGQAQHTEPAPAPLESDAANEEVTRQSAGKVCAVQPNPSRWIKPSILGTSRQFETVPDCDEPTQPLRTAIRGKCLGTFHREPSGLRSNWRAPEC